MRMVLDNGMVAVDRIPVAWVDTCVMLEIDTFGDIMKAKQDGTPDEVEYRRLRMQGTLWMATIFSLGKAVTLSYSHEWKRNFEKLTKDQQGHDWSRTLYFLFHDGGVLDGWLRGTTSAAEGLSGNGRDAFMREQCLKLRMVVYITHDGPSFKKAEAMGVRTATPAQYAETVIPRSLAQRYFMDRLRVATDRLMQRFQPEEHEQRAREMKSIHAVFEYIWKPVGPAAPFSAESMFR